jgi:tetratricopeptide (TPR) repeat protein
MNAHCRLSSVLILTGLLASVACAQSAEALMNSGQDYLRNGAYSQAITQFRKVLAADPSQFEAQHNIAFCYLQMGRYPDAIREFKRAIDMNGRNAETWANLAFAYEQDNKSDKAMEALSTSVSLDPNNVTARMNLATMYANAERYPSAIAQFKQVIAADSRNSEAYLNLAKCLINSKNPGEAVKYLQEVITLEPGNAEAHGELGNVYWASQKQADKAASEYKTAIALNPGEAKYYQDLANIQHDLGKKDEEIETLKNSLLHCEDALAKEKIQKRIDALEGKGTADVKSGSAAPAVDMGMTDLKRDLRGDSAGSGSRVHKTEAVDVSGDFSDINSSKGDELDLTKEAKKRAKDDKKKK